MDYQFESLGADKFQQFCQSLLSTTYKDLVCYPIGQPDGGRDAAIKTFAQDRQEFIIFQVKYVKKPLAEKTPHKWLLAIMSEEIPKIKNLIPKGASKYYLLTNVPGTSHLESGSIDLMTDILSDLGIEANCWWRDDISRRLDTNSELRWTFPELLSGVDILKHLVEKGITENSERRTSIVKAFIRDQYEIEKEVRFKQVELANKLLDLFIDVPIKPRFAEKKQAQEAAIIMMSLAKETDEDSIQLFRKHGIISDEFPIGAATFLLTQITQNFFPELVLEGAPGQGKSTITQYICQVHRIRMLNIVEDIRLVNKNHVSSPLKLPIRADLRDFAVWITKKNPFTSDKTFDNSDIWKKSLESFIVALINHHSGNNELLITDLYAICKTSAVLLVFDGLDEIADIELRQEVINEINRGIKRIKENSLLLQTIITSRPAAFSNSPGFSSKTYPHISLNSLSPKHIDKYTDKWIKAKRLQRSEGIEIKRILNDKLDQPHLSSLARNPMQLAILLSLIHNRGESLPNKRTELYDCYIDHFFSREAQKSSVVRENRDLLINIHGYIAWLLQSEVENQSKNAINNGIISTQRLEIVVHEYLENEGYEPTLANQLFTGMVERVVALVSRVQGTFEFEVQPLREYFAAKYLYETAPYSPPGNPKQGNLLERFDALSKNFYWLNVVRFFAGCFSIGELPSLADKIIELNEDNYFSLTSHPKNLAATLLSDWVFSQHPRSMNRVIEIVSDNIDYYIQRPIFFRSDYVYPLEIPKHCGGSEILKKSFSLLATFPPLDIAINLLHILESNGNQNDIKEEWMKLLGNIPVDKRRQWLFYGNFLTFLSTDEISKFIGDDITTHSWISFLLSIQKFGLIESNEESFTKAIDVILDNGYYLDINRKNPTLLEKFILILQPSQKHLIRTSIWSRRKSTNDTYSISEENLKTYKLAEKVNLVCEKHKIEFDNIKTNVVDSLSSWDNIVELIRELFGDRWAIYVLANNIGIIDSIDQNIIQNENVFDQNCSLCQRIYTASKKNRSLKWWLAQIDNINTEIDGMFYLLLLFSWGHSTIIKKLLPQLEILTSNIEDQKIKLLIDYFKYHIVLNKLTKLSIRIKDLPENMGENLIALISIFCDEKTNRYIYNKYLSNYTGDNKSILDICITNAVDTLFEKPKDWHNQLEIIQDCYKKNLSYSHQINLGERILNKLPKSAIETILKTPKSYPLVLVSIAESMWREYIAQKIIPIAKISHDQEWFC